MIDHNGFRLNVGIIIANDQGKVFWGKRIGHHDAWQFPQGGVNPYETLEETMYRELKEEVGLNENDVKILGITRRWLYYKLPYKMRRLYSNPLCIGQKQKWFLLHLKSEDNQICLDHTDTPEFSLWRWVNYWYPLKQVIYFKHNVYEKALNELSAFIKLPVVER